MSTRRPARRAAATTCLAYSSPSEVKINYKVREHSLTKIPALLVVGKKEAETHSVSVRRFGSEVQKVMPTDEAIAALVAEATPPDLVRTKAARAA